MKLSDLVPDYCTHPDDLVGVVPLRGLQTEVDASTVAVLPGDDVEGHTFHTEPNPHLYTANSKLRAMLRSGELEADDERAVRRALALQELH